VDAVVNLKQLRREVPGKVIMGNVSTFALAAGKQDTIQALCQRVEYLSSGVRTWNHHHNRQYPHYDEYGKASNGGKIRC